MFAKAINLTGMTSSDLLKAMDTLSGGRVVGRFDLPFSFSKLVKANHRNYSSSYKLF